MIKLFLHIGTNKTGSSFLQSTLITNKSIFQDGGVLLPESKWDETMLRGKITPGNGHSLAKLLIEKNEFNLRKYLCGLFEEAKRHQCDKVLLSNEVLIRLFSDINLLLLLEKVSIDVGFASLSYLSFNRNIFEHSLSLYKHRAKYGQFGSYEKWFAEDYETVRIYKRILENKKQSSASWTFLLYQKNSSEILMGLLTWIEFHKPERIVPYPKAVNSSLTLGQIKIMAELREQYVYKITELYNKFSAISDQSSDSYDLKKRFFDVADSFFGQHQAVLSEVNSLLKPYSDSVGFLHKPMIAQDTRKELNSTSLENRIVKKFTERSLKNTVKKVRYYLEMGKKKAILFLGLVKKYDMRAFGGSLK